MRCSVWRLSDDGKVVFLGDSITQYWSSYTDFEAEGWIDKGISGQTTAQIAARFQTDVIALHPQAVHILAGTNDLTSQWVPQQTWDAYTQMLTAAHEAGIHVLMGTIPPWGLGTKVPAATAEVVQRNMRVQRVNAWIRSRTDVTVVDYDALLAGNNGFYQPALTLDGIHPGEQGYAEMTPAATIAILGWRGSGKFADAPACANPAVVLRLPGL